MIGDNSGSGAGDMPVLLYLRPQDVANIKSSWASVERQLVEVGVRVFISLLENQPNIKRTFRKYRSKRHSELRYILLTIRTILINPLISLPLESRAYYPSKNVT